MGGLAPSPPRVMDRVKILKFLRFGASDTLFARTLWPDVAAHRRGSWFVVPEWRSGLGSVTLHWGDGLARPRSTINTSSLVVFGGYVRRTVILCSTFVRYFWSIPVPIYRLLVRVLFIC